MITESKVSARILDVRVDPGRLDDTAESVLEESKNLVCGRYICVANVHMIVTAVQNERFRNILDNAYQVVSDGMPLVHILRMKGYRSVERVAGPDLVDRLCRGAPEKHTKLYFYGGTIEVLDNIRRMCEKTYPALEVVGWESPPIIPDEPQFDSSAVYRIKESGANVVLIGLGCPKQERWMSLHAPHLPMILIGVGAAFDFMSGKQKRAPLWMQKLSMEWLYRLYKEPQRLWKRYFYTNFMFLYYCLRNSCKFF